MRAVGYPLKRTIAWPSLVQIHMVEHTLFLWGRMNSETTYRRINKGLAREYMVEVLAFQNTRCKIL